MNMYESLVFRPYGRADGHLTLVLRTHDLSGTDYEPLFSVAPQVAKGIAAGCHAIRFLFDEPESDRPVEPIKLVAVCDKAPTED